MGNAPQFDDITMRCIQAFTLRKPPINQQELAARDFDSAESTKIAGILCVFPNLILRGWDERPAAQPQLISSDVTILVRILLILTKDTGFVILKKHIAESKLL